VLSAPLIGKLTAWCAPRRLSSSPRLSRSSSFLCVHFPAEPLRNQPSMLSCCCLDHENGQGHDAPSSAKFYELLPSVLGAAITSSYIIATKCDETQVGYSSDSVAESSATVDHHGCLWSSGLADTQNTGQEPLVRDPSSVEGWALQTTSVRWMLLGCILISLSLSSFVYRSRADRNVAVIFVTTAALTLIAGCAAGADPEVILLAILPWSACLAMMATDALRLSYACRGVSICRVALLRSDEKQDA
jgi:hypothetical protein